MAKLQPVGSNIIFPYKNFRFQVKWDNDVIAGVSKVTGLKWTTEVVSHREGNDPSTARHSPGRTAFEPITLERGITIEPAFITWANLVWNTSNGTVGGISLAGYKKNITIELFNTQAVLVRRYSVYNAWVSSFTGQADLDANANAVLIESMVLQNEGWQVMDDPGPVAANSEF
jgi:phage tail-like protein